MKRRLTFLIVATFAIFVGGIIRWMTDRLRVDRSRHLRTGEEHRVVGEGDSQAGDWRHAARENAASGQSNGRRFSAVSGNGA